MKKCPFCAEEIQEESVKCRFCGEFLDDFCKPKTKTKTKWYYSTSLDCLNVKAFRDVDEDAGAFFGPL